jgi:fluoroacetyl-CoA thioesterase
VSTCAIWRRLWQAGVTGEAEVTRVDGCKIEFSVSATDGNEQIGVGTHERMVIDSAKLAARMKAKFG